MGNTKPTKAQIAKHNATIRKLDAEFLSEQVDAIRTLMWTVAEGIEVYSARIKTKQFNTRLMDLATTCHSLQYLADEIRRTATATKKGTSKCPAHS